MPTASSPSASPSAPVAASAATPPAVLHLIHSLGVGGAEILTAELVGELHRRGHWLPTVAAWKCGGPVSERIRATGVEALCFHRPRRSAWLLPLLIWDVLGTVRTVAAEARRREARLIHAHMDDSAVIAVAAGWWIGLPVVATEHCTVPLPPKLRAGSLKYRLRGALLRWSYQRCQRLIAVSPTVAEVLSGPEIGVAPERIATITNGVPTPLPPKRSRAQIRTELGISGDAVVVVCVGRLVPNKNQLALVRMLPLLLARHPQVRLLIVGEGADESMLRAAAGPEVVFSGRRDDVGDLLAASDLFVTASRFEGISLALLEAMARGLPAVACRCPGNTEVLVDGGGLLVDDDRPETLAGALADLLDDQERLTALATAGRQRVAERFSLDAGVVRVEEVYAEVVASHKPSKRRM